MTIKRTHPTAFGNEPAGTANASGITPRTHGTTMELEGSKRSYAFRIVQYLKHPETGASLMTPAQLQSGLDHRSIKKWAWVMHNKDVSADGTPIPPHFHIAVKCDDARHRDQMAKWFGVPLNLVEPLEGHGAFISFVRYLTHEDPNQQARGKYRYPDSCVVSNFDWRSEVDAEYADPLKIPTRRDELRMAVLKGERTLWEVIQAEPVLYANDSGKLKSLARDYAEACALQGVETPQLQDMKLRIRTGVTLTEALTWIAKQNEIEGNSYDRMLWAANVVMGKRPPEVRDDEYPSSQATATTAEETRS